MKIGWWAEVSITPETFVFGTPNNHLPLIKEAEARGHQVELIHVPWKVDGQYVLEGEQWGHLRKQGNLGDAINRRKALERIVAENSGLDATMRTFEAATEYCKNEPTELPYDMVFMKLPPPGFLRTKLEVVYNMWRFMRAGVPTFVFDGDLMWDQAVEWVMGNYSHSNPAFLHARTPYLPKKKLPNWKFQPYFYDPLGNMLPGFNGAEMYKFIQCKAYDLVYVGNDWKQADSPRAAGLGKFYSVGNNQIYGRWTEENQVLSGVPREFFKGPIPANQVRDKYSQARASVVLGLPAYYKVGLVTQRYREIIQAGALCLVDGAYSQDVTDRYVAPKYRVDTVDDVMWWVDIMRSSTVALEHLEGQRKWVLEQQELRIETWIDELERIAS